MLNAKENYQKKLAQYIQVVREIHTVKKVRAIYTYLMQTEPMEGIKCLGQ